jgi:Ala-tRNA(Pro) deacylase
MGIATRLKAYLDGQGVAYDLHSHPRTESSSRTAQVAHVPGGSLAKSVLIHRGQDYLLALVPSSHRIELRALQELVGADVSLATEDEIGRLFDDCDLGAVPAVGAAYGLPVLLDDGLAQADEVYFEGGDHTTLVRVSGDGFRQLMKDALRGRFSHPAGS